MIKKLLCFLALLMVLVYIVELRNNSEEPIVAVENPVTTIHVEIQATPTPAPTPEPTPEPLVYHLDGYSAEQIADYFCEVALSVEYNHGSGDSTALQKWNNPIFFGIYGDYTAEDVALINSFASQLNEIIGLPGMHPAPNAEMENFTIRFMNRQDMNASAGYVVNGEYADGITLWDYYTDSNEIYNTRIWICSEISQYTRNSVILEEIVNSLGLGNDTELREDSIIYQFYSEPQELSEVDWLLLKLLYSEEMYSGIHETECRELISKLYK